MKVEKSATEWPKGVRGVEVACSRLLHFGCLSLRSPCATADSQRTTCIIRTLQLQIKKEKINNRKIKHVVRGILLDSMTNVGKSKFFLISYRTGSLIGTYMYIRFFEMLTVI